MRIAGKGNPPHSVEWSFVLDNMHEFEMLDKFLMMILNQVSQLGLNLPEGCVNSLNLFSEVC